MYTGIRRGPTRMNLKHCYHHFGHRLLQKKGQFLNNIVKFNPNMISIAAKLDAEHLNT